MKNLIRNTNGFFSSLVERWFVAPKNRVRFPKKPLNDFVAQLVEHQSVKPKVEGSNPSEIAKNGSLW